MSAWPSRTAAMTSSNVVQGIGMDKGRAFRHASWL